jgi:hypothetical protein
MLMQNWEVKFRDGDGGGSFRMEASGYRLSHNDLVLSFHDDKGSEVFATSTHNVLWWRPLSGAGASAGVPGELRSVSPVTSAPNGGQSYGPGGAEGQGRPDAPIGASVAADLGRRVAGG